MATARARQFNRLAECLESRAVTMLLTQIREKQATQTDFVRAADRLMGILAEESLGRLAKEVTITTPCGTCSGLQAPPGHSICAVDIIRSGGILLEAVRRILPDLKTAKILIQRDEETSLPKFFYKKFPDGMENCEVILCDPMLATGGSAIMAVECLKQAGVPEEKILFVNVVAAPEGLRAMAAKAPGVRILTAAVDETLNDNKFIVPGLGDFGDRYYGTTGYTQGFWGTAGR